MSHHHWHGGGPGEILPRLEKRATERRPKPPGGFGKNMIGETEMLARTRPSSRWCLRLRYVGWPGEKSPRYQCIADFM
jgi:hypothetical protein